jgi:hypothetical protein
MPYLRPVWSCRSVLAFVVLLGLGFATSASLRASCPSSTAQNTPPSVLTSQYDNLRDGYNPNETILTQGALGSTVSLCQPTWSPLAVDSGQSGLTNGIWAQPLYLAGSLCPADHRERECLRRYLWPNHPGR